ncbi:MAG: hypothetical protein KJP09_10110, partial [Bacteroidia bacterium]|nr:hypothetical protein [Bacteroidia bacterium]
MKLNLRFKICFCAMLLCTVLATKAQTCIGNTFVFPGVPSSCTYTYTTSGWDIIPPTSISSGDSVCILADITTNFDQIDGSIYIAPGVTFTGQINSYETAIIDGTLDLTNSPSITGGDALFISSTGTVNFIGNTTITGPSIIHNNGNLNIIGDLSLTGSSSIIVYEDGHFVVQGNASLTGSNGISNCGIFELVTGTLSSSGDPALQNECTVYINNDFVMSGDYTNNGTTIVNGTIDLNGNDLYNNDLVLVDHLIVDGDNFIGNNTSSVLIVRNNAELINGASITDHFYYDIDDGGGFDTVCGSCTEDITILANVTVPNDQDLIKDDCGANIIPDLHCLISSSTDSDGDGINDSCDLDDDNDGIPDTDELGTIISTEQQPCGGDMSLDFSGTQTLLSGTDLQQGAVYRFSDVHTGPDLDAIVTIVETNNATVVELDRNVTTPESFKPRTGFNFANAGEFGYIEYLIQFVDKGTTNPYTIGKFFMNFNDLDGGSNFGEQNWADNPKTYTIDDPTEVTMNTDGTWIVATGATSDYGPSTNEFPYINFAVNYTNKSEIRIRVGAVARVAGVSSSGRSHSIEFNCVTNYVAPKTYSLDGDFDGLANHLDLDSDNDG